MGRFAEYVAAGDQLDVTLPAAHATDLWHLRQVIENAAVIKTNQCDVYNESLLYCFYGRPCYRMHGNADPTSLRAFYLVSILISMHTLPTFKRVLPFDSGAFNAQLYKAYIHPKMRLADFEVSPNASSVTKIVSLFFGDNKAYFSGAAASNIKVSSMELEAEAYFALAKNPAQTSFDDRRSTIEIQLDRPIDLNQVEVLAVIMPEQLLDDPEIAKFVEVGLGAELIGYYCTHARPTEDARAIMSEATSYSRVLGQSYRDKHT